MRKALHLVILSAAIVLSSAAQAVAQKPDVKAAPAGALPSADQIVDKYITGSGGKAALEKITSRTQKGTLEVPAFSVSGPLQTLQQGSEQELLLGRYSGVRSRSAGLRRQGRVVARSAKRDSGAFGPGVKGRDTGSRIP